MDFVVLNKWHRYLGFTTAIFVVALAITGIMLNHTAGLDLGKKPLPAWLAKSVYGVDISQGGGFAAGDLHLRKMPNDQLEISATGQAAYSLPCKGRFLGAVQLPDQWAAACTSTIVFLTASGELIDTVGQAHGIPAPLGQLGVGKNQLIVASAGQYWLFDNKTLGLELLDAGGENILDIDWLEGPDPANNLLNHLTVERFVLDLHSGRAFGGWGVWLMDLVALVLIVLVISGYIAWREKQKLFAED